MSGAVQEISCVPHVRQFGFWFWYGHDDIEVAAAFHPCLMLFGSHRPVSVKIPRLRLHLF